MWKNSISSSRSITLLWNRLSYDQFLYSYVHRTSLCSLFDSFPPSAQHVTWIIHVAASSFRFFFHARSHLMDLQAYSSSCYLLSSFSVFLSIPLFSSNYWAFLVSYFKSHFVHWMDYWKCSKRWNAALQCVGARRWEIYLDGENFVKGNTSNKNCFLSKISIWHFDSSKRNLRAINEFQRKIARLLKLLKILLFFAKFSKKLTKPR